MLQNGLRDIVLRALQGHVQAVCCWPCFCQSIDINKLRTLSSVPDTLLSWMLCDARASFTVSAQGLHLAVAFLDLNVRHPACQ